MKNILRQEKGVSLISLGVAIIIMIIITSLLVYNAKDTTQINKLNKMYDDIANLRDEISVYYSKYGEIPVYKNKEIDFFDKSIVGVNDTGAFYIIDLKAMDGLTLNYGKDYENIRDGIDSDDTVGDDIYIINEASHNIFYLKGITIDNNTYYTNYTDDEKDSKKVDLRYVNGIKIPDGYYYIRKNNDTIIIANDSNVEYQWKTITIEITQSTIENGKYYLNEEDKEDFIISANENKGYFFNISNDGTENVVFTKVEDTWSPEYKQEGTYTDEDGYTAYIPEGFCVSTRPSMNKIKKGLVIKDVSKDENGNPTETNGNEYVWINVPKYITADCATTQQIEEALQKYASNYREDGYEDVWYDGCGISSKDEYNKLKSNMLESIKQNGGFYIGRYEAGTSTKRTNGSTASSADDLKELNGLPLSQKNMYVYNFLTVSQAQKLASLVGVSNHNTSLMFGIQWDLVCKFIEESGVKTSYEIKTDSTSWGNYSNAKFTIKSGQYSSNNGQSYNNADNTLKSEVDTFLLKTGLIAKNSALNIFDLAGNIKEYTLENKIVLRGGHFGIPGTKEPLYNRETPTNNEAIEISNGFRVTIF